MSNHIDNKVIRPGSMNYNHASLRQAYATDHATETAPTNRRLKLFITVLAVLVISTGGGLVYAARQKSTPVIVVSKSAPALKTNSTPATATAVTVTNYCASNTLNKDVVVSISARHLWACDGTTLAYDSPVVTGIEYLPADKTPVGTYQVYGKITDTVLKGSDTTGSWSDPVSYWMPFLDNQYGAYGFHDATWRPATAFGNIDPNSAQGSHGCVELPLATAAWLYDWVQIGTTVTIES
jgi:lipoprotein-anchoring transpeptidase ErfK/SrfK